MSTNLEVRAMNIAGLDALDAASREVAVTGMLDQCRQWLATAVEATEPKRISEFKAFVATIAETTKQLNLSKEIQLHAVEMVRRAERGVGVAIRQGQEEGTVARQGNPYDRTSYSPDEFMKRGTPSMETYAMTDGVSDEKFDDAIAKAKTEGNLSRANVVRKLRSETAGDAEVVAPRTMRRPLVDGFRSAALDLDRVAGRISRLARDDRFTKNADQISHSYLHDLIRARDALQCVIDQLPSLKG